MTLRKATDRKKPQEFQQVVRHDRCGGLMPVMGPCPHCLTEEVRIIEALERIVVALEARVPNPNRFRGF